MTWPCSTMMCRPAPAEPRLPPAHASRKAADAMSSRPDAVLCCAVWLVAATRGPKSGDVATAPHEVGVPICVQLSVSSTNASAPLRCIVKHRLLHSRVQPPLSLPPNLKPNPPVFHLGSSRCSFPTMAAVNWRTINIDALDPDSPANFDLSSLVPAVTPVSTADVQNNASQIRQLLRGGDNEGALQSALENPPYGADDKGKVRLVPPRRSHSGVG